MNNLNPQQIEILVKHFYRQVQQDEVLGPIFNDIAQVDWDEHIPLICRFWNTVMFGTNDYEGGAYPKHVALAQKTLITEAHFTRWLELFTKTAQAYLPSTAVDEIVKRANMIAIGLKRGMLNA